jgi:Phage tail assembly chaperone protein, TAC
VTWAFRTWLTWAEPFGLGELQLTPATFWHLTPREFAILHAGFHRRQDREWEKVAALGLWVLAPYSKKKLTIKELLGRSKLETLPPQPEFDIGHGEAAEQALEVERARVLAEALKWAKD